MSLVSCTKNTGIVVTKPSNDLVLTKMHSGNWTGAKANGNSLTVTGGTKHQGDYTFDSSVLGIGAMYADGKGNYLLTVPMGKDLVLVTVDQDGKKAIDAVLDVLDDAGGEAVIGNLVDVIVKEGAGNLDLSNPDKILAGTNISMDKYKEVESILMASNKDSFTNAETIK
ncbi:hypothetical protein [Brachyspira pulli]|uniref:hypothetical protein n=1 Tax=Brachyspira pulli TaxID=310721 RepID=UPI0030058679